MRVPVRDIMQCVGAAYGLTLEDLRGDCRKRRVARPRQIAMYLARDITRHSLPHIGIRFNRNHTTVLAGLRRIKGLMEKDAALATRVAALRAQISGEV